MVKVHYFYDPMCGWCYGAMSLLTSIVANAEIKLELHPGGMIASKTIDANFRDIILASDKRIAKMTGVSFGEKYIERVESNDEMVLDSFITVRAIITAEQLDIEPVDMLKSIQYAHYFEGKQVNHPEVLAALSVKLGAESAQWHKAMNANLGIEQAEIQKSHLLMQQLQVQCYPTLFLEIDKKWIALPHREFYDKPEEWQQLIDKYTRRDRNVSKVI